MIGSYVLAGEIASLYRKDRPYSIAAVVEGLKNYEEKFRPIATANHGGSEWFNEWFESILAPKSSLGISIMHTFVAVAAYLRLDQRIGFDSKTSKWPLPEYPELERDLTLD